MARLIAVANLKGGCGKSTIAVNVACELAQKSTVELIDADAQGTTTAWAGQGGLPVHVNSLPLDGRNGAESWMRAVLGIEADYVVIDCPPHVGNATQAAVGIADLVLIPVTASGADIIATTGALDLVGQARIVRKGDGPDCLMVPSRIDRRTSAGREIEKALKSFGEAISPAVCQRTAFVDAFGAGQWIGDFEPKGKAFDEIVALSRAVAKRKGKRQHGQKAA